MNDIDLEANSEQDLTNMPLNYIPIEWFNSWYDREEVTNEQRSQQ